MKALFASSLFDEIRKRMGQSAFEAFLQVIIDANDGEKTKSKPELEAVSENQKPQKNLSPEQPAKDSTTIPTKTEALTDQGKLLLNTTVVEQVIC